MSTIKTVRSSIVFAFLVVVMVGVWGLSAAAASNHDDVRKVQQSLAGKGFYQGQVDGILGPRTRQAIGDYQKAEHQPVTGRLDAETAGKLGVGPESVGGDFKGAGHEVKEGTKEAGNDISNGKPVTAGKEFGKGIGRAGKKVGKGVKGAVTP